MSGVNDKKIPFNEFIDGYVKCKTDSLKNRYIEEKLVYNKYVPFAFKKFLAEQIVSQSCISRGEDGTKRLQIDSCAKHISYVYTVIMAYTNISIDGTEGTEGYDKFMMSGLKDVIFSDLPEDIVEFDVVLDMVYDDFYTNNYNTQAFITNIVDRIAGSTLASVLEKFSDETTN